MRLLFILAAVIALAVARPELYKEQEDFKFSRSSSDDGAKSGFYGAQRGNMGGNYERAHNMDSLAQNQMSGLVRQVEGELGDGAKTRTGSVYSAANSRGTYGSGHYDLSNLAGRNFQEGTYFDSSNAHSSQIQSGAAYNRAGYANTRSQSYGDTRYGGFQRAASEGQTQVSDDLQSLDNSQTSNGYNYGRSASHNSGYQLESGFQEQSEYDRSNSNSHSGYGSNVRTRLISATPVKIILTPGRRVAIPVVAQTYDTTQGSSVIDQNARNSEADVLSLNNQGSNVGSGNAKHYESSYSYRKKWEKHDTVPTAEVVITRTESPVPKNNELYEDTEAHGFNSQYNAVGSDSQTAHVSSSSSRSNGASSGQSRLESNYNTHQRRDSTNANSDAFIQTGYNAGANHGALSDSLRAHQGQYASRYHGASSDSNLNAYTQTGYNAGSHSDLNNQVENLNARPKSYSSSYAYHKSWERQGDPYIIKPASSGYSDSQSSQRLTSSTKNVGARGTIYHTGAHYGQDLGDCDENGHIRVARSPNTNDNGQESQRQWDNTEDLNQQLQTSWEQKNEGQQSQTGWAGLEDLNQQSQSNWDQQNVGQQTQSNWDQQNLGQQSQSNWDTVADLEQQVNKQWGKPQKIEQQGTWDKPEDIEQLQQTTNSELEQQFQNFDDEVAPDTFDAEEKQQTQKPQKLDLNTFTPVQSNRTEIMPVYKQFYWPQNYRTFGRKFNKSFSNSKWFFEEPSPDTNINNKPYNTYNDNLDQYYKKVDSNDSVSNAQDGNSNRFTNSLTSKLANYDNSHRVNRAHKSQISGVNSNHYQSEYAGNCEHNSQTTSQGSSLTKFWDRFHNSYEAASGLNVEEQHPSENETLTSSSQSAAASASQASGDLPYLNTDENSKYHHFETTSNGAYHRLQPLSTNFQQLVNKPVIREEAEGLQDIGRGDISSENLSGIVERSETIRAVAVQQTNCTSPDTELKGIQKPTRSIAQQKALGQISEHNYTTVESIEHNHRVTEPKINNLSQIYHNNANVQNQYFVSQHVGSSYSVEEENLQEYVQQNENIEQVNLHSFEQGGVQDLNHHAKHQDNQQVHDTSQDSVQKLRSTNQNIEQQNLHNFGEVNLQGLNQHIENIQNINVHANTLKPQNPTVQQQNFNQVGQVNDKPHFVQDNVQGTQVLPGLGQQNQNIKQENLRKLGNDHFQTFGQQNQNLEQNQNFEQVNLQDSSQTNDNLDEQSIQSYDQENGNDFGQLNENQAQQSLHNFESSNLQEYGPQTENLEQHNFNNYRQDKIEEQHSLNDEVQNMKEQNVHFEQEIDNDYVKYIGKINEYLEQQNVNIDHEHEQAFGQQFLQPSKHLEDLRQSRDTNSELVFSVHDDNPEQIQEPIVIQEHYMDQETNSPKSLDSIEVESSPELKPKAPIYWNNIRNTFSKAKDKVSKWFSN